MNPEIFNPTINQAEKKPDKEKTTPVAERVRKFVALGFRVELDGAEKLKEISKDKHLIFLTTHMSNHDMPITIAALAQEKANLKVAEASTHKTFSKNPSGYIGRKAIGEENSFSIEYTGGQGDGDGIFDPDDYEPMQEALTDGYDMVIAAHFDSKYKEKEWRLPKNGGYGGVYLANITSDSIIIPVAVDIQSAEQFGMTDIGVSQIIKERRPKAKVSLGEPLEPKKIENLDKFAEILRKRKKNIPITAEEREIFKNVHKELRLESNRVMESLANMLPKEKRSVSGELKE